MKYGDVDIDSAAGAFKAAPTGAVCYQRTAYVIFVYKHGDIKRRS